MGCEVNRFTFCERESRYGKCKNHMEKNGYRILGMNIGRMEQHPQ